MRSDDQQKGRFFEILKPELPRLQAFCQRLAGDSDLGDDRMQDGPFDAWRGFGRLKQESAFRAWLYRIVINRYRTNLRKLMQVLDSLGGQHIYVMEAKGKSREHTIWQLLVTDTRQKEGNTLQTDFHPERDGLTTDEYSAIDRLKKMVKGEFFLWIPTGEQSGDSLRGILLKRTGDKTIGQSIGGPIELEPDECSWHQYLSNAVMNTTTPDGEQATFNLFEIEDVRKLEKMGYNFATMKFESPGQIPIPDMGPNLNEIRPNPFQESATIEVMIPQAYEVQVQILDERGTEIRTWLDCIMLAGIRSLSWDGCDDKGNLVAPGTYLCRFIAGEYIETQEIRFVR